MLAADDYAVVIKHGHCGTAIRGTSRGSITFLSGTLSSITLVYTTSPRGFGTATSVFPVIFSRLHSMIRNPQQSSSKIFRIITVRFTYYTNFTRTLLLLYGDPFHKINRCEKRKEFIAYQHYLYTNLSSLLRKQIP